MLECFGFRQGGKGHPVVLVDRHVALSFRLTGEEEREI